MIIIHNAITLIHLKYLKVFILPVFILPAKFRSIFFVFITLLHPVSVVAIDTATVADTKTQQVRIVQSAANVCGRMPNSACENKKKQRISIGNECELSSVCVLTFFAECFSFFSSLTNKFHSLWRSDEACISVTEFL